MSLGAFCQAPHWNWYNLFYLPYDNDLHIFADTVQAQIGHGSDTTSVLNVAYVEIPGFRADYRSIFLPGEQISVEWIEPHVIDKTNADVVNRSRADHSALFLLGHGGRLDEVRMRIDTDTTWMSIADWRINLEEENEYLEKFDLFFYQVCSKGSIEAVYEVAGLAEFSMASQFPIGAPNYYYEKVLDQMGRGEIDGGLKLAREIARQDRPDMYLAYSIYDNDKLVAFTDSLLSFLSVPESMPAIWIDLGKVKDAEYGGEKYMDIRDLLPILKKAKVIDRKEFRLLKGMLAAVCETVLSPALEGEMLESIRGFSGLSVLLGTQEVSGDYSRLKMYQSDDWVRLMGILKAR